MKGIPVFQVDAFTSEVFRGNPAAVCPLEQWMETGMMQTIAMENNLAETVFFVPEGEGFSIRWFTPEREVDLCGHATLASAHVLFQHLGHSGETIVFSSVSGPLTVRKTEKGLCLDFPSRPPVSCDLPTGLEAGLRSKPLEVLKSRDYVAVFSSEEEIRALQPDFHQLAKVDSLGIIVTAPGKDHDFVSRFFAPGAGIPEDPVTGSAHATLIPYWSQRLGKKNLHAFQASARGGELWCALKDDRVDIAGQAVTFMEGRIYI